MLGLANSRFQLVTLPVASVNVDVEVCVRIDPFDFRHHAFQVELLGGVEHRRAGMVREDFSNPAANKPAAMNTLSLALVIFSRRSSKQAISVTRMQRVQGDRSLALCGVWSRLSNLLRSLESRDPQGAVSHPQEQRLQTPTVVCLV